MDDIPIPPEVVEAARNAFFSDKGMRGAIVAALKAWPDAWTEHAFGLDGEIICLPIQRETSHD